MRNFAARSLITLAAMTTPMLAVAAAVRSQPKPTTPNTTTSVEISRPEKPAIPSGKKASFVKMFEDIAIAPRFTPKAIELRGISGGGVETQTKSGRKVTETGDCIGFVDAEPDHKITLEPHQQGSSPAARIDGRRTQQRRNGRGHPLVRPRRRRTCVHPFSPPAPRTRLRERLSRGAGARLLGSTLPEEFL